MTPLHLERLWISESLIAEMEDREEIEIVGEPVPLEFDAEGRLIL